MILASGATDLDSLFLSVVGSRGSALPDQIAIASRIEPLAELSPGPDGRNTLRLYGVIGSPWKGIDPKMVAHQLDKAGDAPLLVTINSPGGRANDGIAIHNLLRQYPGDVTTRVDGVAASAAGIVYLAGDRREIPKESGSLMMHQSHIFGVVHGNAEEIQKQIDKAIKAMARIDQSQAAIMARATGMEEEKALEALSGETWWGPKDAMESGMATHYVPDKAQAPKSQPQPKAFAEMMEAWGYSHVPSEPETPVDESTEKGDFRRMMLDALRKQTDFRRRNIHGC